MFQLLTFVNIEAAGPQRACISASILWCPVAVQRSAMPDKFWTDSYEWRDVAEEVSYITPFVATVTVCDLTISLQSISLLPVFQWYFKRLRNPKTPSECVPLGFSESEFFGLAVFFELHSPASNISSLLFRGFMIATWLDRVVEHKNWAFNESASLSQGTITNHKSCSAPSGVEHFTALQRV